MNRKSNEVSGFVNFPLDNQDYRNTNEGGMFVRLVVEPIDDNFTVCAGPSFSIIYNEVFVQDDQENDGEYHFPGINSCVTGNKWWDWYDQHRSLAYLAVVEMGSSGWSGWSDMHENYWVCKYDDLTPEGKDLYKIIEKTFRGKGKLFLQTWLDT